jgi:threonine dehydratase
VPPDPTPLEDAPAELAGGRQLLLKREDLHELGAFKWRGALPALAAYRERGDEAVVTASTGNHGAATAWAAERTGMRAVVFVPEEVSRTKLELLERLGAEVHRAGASADESKDHARAHAERTGIPFFEDGDEPAQYEGYAAIGRELIEQLGERPALTVVPVGDGALMIGVARGLGGDGVVGVVAKEAPVIAWSVEAGRPVDCDRCATFADGLAVRVPVPRAVEELSRLRPPFVQVSERAMARAVARFAAAGIRVEGSAAAPLAALDQLQLPGGPIVLIVTGRNIDEELYRRALEDPASFPD